MPEEQTPGRLRFSDRFDEKENILTAEASPSMCLFYLYEIVFCPKCLLSLFRRQSGARKVQRQKKMKVVSSRLQVEIFLSAKMRGAVLLITVLVTMLLAKTVASSGLAYRVTFSSRVRPGALLPVSVHLFRAGDAADVFVSLRDSFSKAVVASAPSELVSGGDTPQVIYLMVPPELRTQNGTSTSSYELRVKAIGHVTFDKTAPMSLEDKSFSIFIQTDKAIYKPGQTVSLRALAMNPDLSILKLPMDVLIKDPSGTIMRQWKNVDSGAAGVVQLDMPTSTHPPLGVWTVEAALLGHRKVQSFFIDKYVLPKFEANIRVPRKALTSDGISGTVSAKYTFGKPLTGADVTVTIKLQNSAVRPSVTSSGKLDSKGQLKFSVTNAQLLDLASKTFFRRSLDNSQAVIIATVTDPSTASKMEAKEIIGFEINEAKLKFLPISANSFKPGLQYTAYLSVSKFDDTLFSTKEFVDVQLTINTINEKKNVNKHQQLTPNGLVRIDEIFPENAETVSIQVTVKDATETKTLTKALSPSNNFVKILLLSTKLKVGDDAQFSVSATEKVKAITYQVYAKGILVYESVLQSLRQQGDKQFSVLLSVEEVMAPNARLLVFYFRPDGEVVADSIAFKVSGTSENPISVWYPTEKVKPGESVSLVINAEPNSYVFLLAVDKSVQLLKSGNDITQEDVTEELVSYDYGSEYGDVWHDISTSGWLYSVQGTDAESIFEDTNVHLLTGGALLQNLVILNRAVGRNVFYASYLPGPIEMQKEVAKIRTFFPERWLWDMVLIGASGVVVRQVTAPDTITTWLTTAFCVHPQHGLSVTPRAAQLTTFQDVFVSLDLPYSVIRGEDICLKAFAFNEYSSPLQMRMTLGQTDGIDSVMLQSDVSNPTRLTETRRAVSVTHDLGLVRTNEVQETEFCFTPTKIGKLPIRVNLTTSIPGDGVEHTLLVEPEGSRQVQTTTVILDAKPNVLFSQTVPLTFPSAVVQGSQVITVSVSGNLLMAVISNLENLLRLPFGCGEQNMIFFAPNVFLISYLQRTNTYTQSLATKAINYMVTGYQREISYQHKDGSFSAFGERDRSGSMWLTAFVTKCFVQAIALRNNVVTIDVRTVKASLQWIISRQMSNGSFPEPGNVIHKEIQSGSAGGVSLTAFVLIALAEASSKFKDLDPREQENLQSCIAQARLYLEGRLNALIDPYDTIIVTYALHLVRSSYRDAAFSRVQQQRVSGNATFHWERPNRIVNAQGYPWQQQTTALSIEMTSYVLLTHVSRGDVQGAMPILRWLMQNRGPNGGFISTQDTVVGLQALGEMAAANHNPVVVPFTVTVSWRSVGQSFKRTVTINDSNKLVLQVYDVTIVNGNVPAEVQISASTSGTFTGFPEAKVVIEYNVDKPTSSDTYQLTYQITKAGDTAFDLTVAAKRMDGQQGGMTVLEVGIPTGFSVDVTNPKYSVLSSKMQEQGYRKYILYYEEVDASGISAILPMTLSEGISINTQPVPIKIYTYYEPGGRQQLIIYYQLSATKGSVCNRIDTYTGCSSPGLSRR